MIDPFALTMSGIAEHRYAVVPVALLAGAASSVGPCVAPRYLALAAMVGARRPFVPVVAFASGIVIATIALGAGATFARALIANVTAIDAVVALVLIAFGIATVIREPQTCDHARPAAAPRASGAFALGATSTLVVSPCCTPMIVAFAGLGVFERDPLFATIALAAFAFGHTAPIVIAALAGASVRRPVRALAASGAPATVAGSLTIALGAYYGLLA